MAKRDVSKPTYYLDACVLIDLIELPPTDELSKSIVRVLEDADDGRCNLVTSTLTIAEVIFARREIDGKALDPDVEATIARLWHPADSPIQLVEVHELICRDATRLLRDHLKDGWSKTRGNDAIHLITARREFVNEFFTTEKAMKKWEPVMGFKVERPHPAPDLAAEELARGEQSLFAPPPLLAAPAAEVCDPHWIWHLWRARQLIAGSGMGQGAQRSLRKE